MKKPRSFRSPVVMTLAAGAMAAAAGCGGDVITGTNPGCPSTPAMVGTACDPALVTDLCNYGTAYPACPGVYPESRRCDPSTRRWVSVTGTCNPPPPMCPSTPPTQGAACVGALSCNYDSCGPGGVSFAECRNGSWQVLAGSCNPPPPACPATAPADQSPCAPGFGIAVCPYGPPGCGTGSAVFTCGGESTGRWIRHAPRCNTEPSCPAYEPDSTNGFCTASPTTQFCQYGSTNPCDPAHRAYRCDDTGRWTPAISTCNPPPPMCPSTPPQEGASCIGFLDCSYDSCLPGNVGQARCINGSWTLNRGSCNPPPPPPADAGPPDDGGGIVPPDADPPEDDGGTDIFVDAG